MKLILAATKSGGIGYKNGLPWKKIKGDLARFKQLTDKFPVIMGRNTWDSLPIKPLPNRINIVVTSNPFEHEGVTCVDSIMDHTDFYWLIGGAKLVEASWDYINEVHLTLVNKEHECDTFVDLNILEKHFVKVHYEYFEDHQYQIWRRKQNATIS
jgi:dihydrofolate reductase